MVATAKSTTIAQKVTLSTGLNLARQMIAVVSGIIVAREVGPDVLGIVAYAGAYAGMFQSFSDLGFGTAHIKRVSEGYDLGECMGTMWIAKITGLAVMTLAVLVSFWVGGYKTFGDRTGEVVFYLAVVSLIASQLSMVQVCTLAAFQDVVRKDLPATGIQVINSLLRVSVAILGVGAIGLAGADATTTVVLLGIYLWLLRKLPLAWPSRATFKIYLTFGLPMFIVALVTSVGSGLDRIFLEFFAGTGAVGQYSAGMRLGAMLNFLSTAVAGLIFPSMSRAYAEGRAEEAFALCGRAERQLALVLLPLALGVTVVARPTASLLLGAKYPDTGSVIVFGTFAMIFHTLTQPYRQIISASERVTVSVCAELAFFGLQAALLYVFVGDPLGSVPASIRGAPAAAIATAAAAVIAAVLWRTLAVRVLSAKLERRVWIHGVSAAVLFVPAYTLAFSSQALPLLSTVSLAAVVLSIHLAVLRFSGELGPDQIQFLRSLVPDVCFEIIPRITRVIG